MNPTDRTRIQKLVSNYSNYSRREFEGLIKEGKVKINGVKAQLGDHATVQDKIEVDGKVIKFKTKHDYYVVNKPKGYISNRTDERGKPVISLIENYQERNLFTVGRLDVNTTGLIIVTNDGDLSEKVTSPKSGKKKEYLA